MQAKPEQCCPAATLKQGKKMPPTLLHSKRQDNWDVGVVAEGKKGLIITRELQNSTATVSFTDKQKKEQKRKCL